MQLTEKDIIKILPFDELFKRTLLAQFDTLDIDRKNVIGSTLWEVYVALFSLKVEEKMQIAFEKAKNNEIVLDENFYKIARQEAEKEMTEGYFQGTTDADLSAIRSKLQTFLTPN